MERRLNIHLGIIDVWYMESFLEFKLYGAFGFGGTYCFDIGLSWTENGLE